MAVKRQSCWALIGSVSTLMAVHLNAAITIDGVLDEVEWRDAEVYSDFVSVEPLTGEPAKYATEVRMITSDEGIYVGFSNYQPASVKRVKRRFARDAKIEADRNIVSIDFDRTALAGYDFTVGSANSRQDGIVTPGDYSGEWDGIWYSQTSADGDYWYSEMHIPWTVAPMSTSADGRKSMGVWFSRVVYSESLRFAYPNAFYSRPTFMEDWHPIEVDQVTTSSFDWFPYISYSQDLYRDGASSSANEFNTGVDFIWRPNSNTQITGALDPDFGQVESDDLVVNFSAFETMVGEKRPFFTENQSLFSSRIPNNDQMLYTRRIGSGASDGGGLIDVDMGLKFSRFGDNTDVGLFVVREDDSSANGAGDFIASRLQRKVGGLSFGHRLTRVSRDAIDRQATVHALDLDWQPNERIRLKAELLHSDVRDRDQRGQLTQNDRDIAGWLDWSYTPSDEWQQVLYLSHYGDRFDINDMGYMRRNGYREFYGRTRRDRLQYAAGSALLSSSTQVEYGYTENSHGDRLSLWAQWVHNQMFKSTRELSYRLNIAASAWDDRISRGNGRYAKPTNYRAVGVYVSPRGDKFAYHTAIEVDYNDIEKGRVSLHFKPQFYLSETITVGGKLSYDRKQEWLIWDDARQQLAGYNSEHYSADVRFDWYPSTRSEFRLKFQWVGIDAEVISGYQLGPRGDLRVSPSPSSNFSLSDTALQLRYRYQLAPLSDVFLVYSRGGYFDSDSGDEGPQSLFDGGWSGRQIESLIAKIRYRF